MQVRIMTSLRNARCWMMFKIDYQKYFELEKKKKEEMTQEELKFYKWMYHVEECQSGLDGEVRC